MKVTFIMPAVGRKGPGTAYPRTWLMEPLAIATLAALTPPGIEKEFHDDRFDEIDFDTRTCLVAMTVETYTARRSYEIAARFRRRGIPVILGGFHPTLNPEEALAHADSVCIGEAEDLWEGILRDAGAGRLQRVYRSLERPSLMNRFPDRSLFAGKRYLGIGLVETGRGCPHACEFCAISRFFNQTRRERPVRDIVAEIRNTTYPRYFFVDDNIAADPEWAKELCGALIPLRIRWLGQGSIAMAADPELLRLLRLSGCEGMLIGFESLHAQTLRAMNKGFNAGIDFDEAVRRIHGAGLRIYATFVFGYDEQTVDAFGETFSFALRHRFFMAAFNHLVPFPGTGLYRRLQREGRLLGEAYWLDHGYRFGEVTFRPRHFTPGELASLCYRNRRAFYSVGSILRRFPARGNFGGPADPFEFLAVNLLSRHDVRARQGLPMGCGDPL